METIPKGNKRSAENDSVTIDKFLNSKLLRRTLMNEEAEYNEGEEDTVEYHEYGDDEEMVIVVVQNEEANAMDNDYQQVVDDHNIEEEVAYDFINEHENSVSFITERVNSEQPTPSSVAQKEQNFSGKLYPKKIIGTKCLTIKPKKELCRLCLSKQKNMCSLFETSLKFIKSSLKEVIETCIGIKVLRDDATDLICRACISRLESIWAFREQCEQSDRMVKQMKLEKVQQRIADDGNQNLNIFNNEPSLPNYDDPIDDFRVSLSKFSCIDCKKRFHTEIALAAHVTNDHAHLKPFTHNTSYLVNCSICGSRVIKKVLHDHYLQHKIAGEDASAYQDDDEEGDEEFIDGDTYYEETRQHNVENSGMGNDASLQLEGEPEQITSFPDLGDGETMDARNITGILNNKKNQHIYKQNECIVTDITGNEFNVDEGQVNKSILGGVDSNNAKVIAVRINEEENYGETTTTDYSQVYLVNQGENLVETSIPQGNNEVENVVSNTEPNQIYVVASDGKSMYVDNQDVVFQIANDQVYQTDGKGDVELVYENTNSSETVLVKEEVIDTSYDQ